MAMRAPETAYDTWLKASAMLAQQLPALDSRERERICGDEVETLYLTAWAAHGALADSWECYRVCARRASQQIAASDRRLSGDLQVAEDSGAGELARAAQESLELIASLRHSDEANWPSCPSLHADDVDSALAAALADLAAARTEVHAAFGIFADRLDQFTAATARRFDEEPEARRR